MTSQTPSPLLRLLVDSLAVGLACTVAFTLRQWELAEALRFPIQPASYYLFRAPFALGLFLFSFWEFGLYDQRTSDRFGIRTTLRVFRAIGLWLVLLMALAYLSQQDPSRALLLVGGALSVPAVLLGRALVDRSEGAVPFRRVVLIGTPADLASLCERIGRQSGRTVVRTLDIERFLKEEPAAVLTEGSPTDIVLAPPYTPRAVFALFSAAPEVGGIGIHVRPELFPRIPGSFVTHGILEDYAEVTLSVIPRDLWARGGKRLFDVVATTLLSPVALPLAGLCALALWLDAGWPVFFWHERVGKDGRPFRMVKFRTMQVETPAIADAPTSPNDQRVTKAGRLLRRWSLDELPQLWNVLRGDMSLVGPRPEMPHLVAQYEPWQHVRFRVRPGLTGLWQVIGRKELPMHQHVEYDVYYAQNVSFALDAAILWKTLPEVLSGRGAF